MASFQAKTSGKSREGVKMKVVVPICSYPTQYKEFHKNSQKIRKIKKPDNGILSSQNRLVKPEKLWK